MNVIIPMAGKGQRFKEAGYDEDKPFIVVNHKPMMEVALQNLGILDATYHFLVCPGHEDRVHEIAARNLRSWHVYTITERLLGAVPACITLEMRLNPNEPLVIANCDQIVTWNPISFLHLVSNNPDVAGWIPTFKANSIQHSYALCNDVLQERVLKIAEKKVISPHALCGIHYWSKACLAFWSFHKAMLGEPHFNGDYYIAPTYNHLIDIHANVYRYETGGMTVLGTPEQLEAYLENSRANIGNIA